MNRKVYLYYYDWPLTSGNHCGMSHLFREFAKNSSFDVTIRDIRLSPVPPDDALVFFTEYLSDTYQIEYARHFRLRLFKGKIVALIHLPIHMLRPLSRDHVAFALDDVDRVVTFGSALTREYHNFTGKEEDFFVTTFHYVDTNYFNPGSLGIKRCRDAMAGRLRVISTGIYNRDFEIMNKAIKNCPFADFTIYTGLDPNISSALDNHANMVLRPYVAEAEMLKDLRQSDVHISLSRDTHGSNAIMTSMACGLAQVVMDNGSVRDYLDDTNAFLCSNAVELSDSLLSLHENRKGLNGMKNKMYDLSHRYTLEKSILWFNDFIEKEFVKDTI